MIVEYEDMRFIVMLVFLFVILCRFDEMNDINFDMYVFYFVCKFIRKFKLMDRSIILERCIV